jgi:hypothetical protein
MDLCTRSGRGSALSAFQYNLYSLLWVIRAARSLQYLLNALMQCPIMNIRDPLPSHFDGLIP